MSGTLLALAGKTLVVAGTTLAVAVLGSAGLDKGRELLEKRKERKEGEKLAEARRVSGALKAQDADQLAAAHAAVAAEARKEQEQNAKIREVLLAAIGGISPPISPAIVSGTASPAGRPTQSA